MEKVKEEVDIILGCLVGEVIWSKRMVVAVPQQLVEGRQAQSFAALGFYSNANQRYHFHMEWRRRHQNWSRSPCAEASGRHEG